MEAYDSAYPEARTPAEIFINVTRNVNGPQFQPSANYEKVIVDSFGVGEEVLRVRATDGDQTVSTARSGTRLNVFPHRQMTRTS